MNLRVKLVENLIFFSVNSDFSAELLGNVYNFQIGAEMA